MGFQHCQEIRIDLILQLLVVGERGITGNRLGVALNRLVLITLWHGQPG
jgi:hypothetical protein